MRGALLAYQALGGVALALGWPWLAWRAVRDPRYRVGWGERFGDWDPVPSGALWVHGASVGEMGAASPLVSALRERGEALLLTTTSPSGRDAAGKLAGPSGVARLLPLDLGPLIRRALRSGSPRALVLVETELWPALLWEVRRARLPAVLVNARISDRTFPRYRAVRRWLAPLLATFDAIQAQSERDAERFRLLGGPAERIAVGGNLKFDRAPPEGSDRQVTALCEEARRGLQILVAGSTHPEEEEAVLRAWRALREQGLPVGLILAPRHLERLADVEALLAAEGLEARRWTVLEGERAAAVLREGEVVLVDRYGLLAELYGAGLCAFVGGTLVPVGGHNLLEPLSWGVPVVFGPHTGNAPAVRDEVLRRELGVEVDGAAALAAAVAAYAADSAAVERVGAGAETLFAAHRGATRRALAALGRAGALSEGG